MGNIKKAFCVNACIVILEIVSVVWMMSGLNSGVFSASRLAVFRYFTVDSNILMGIAALVAAADERAVMSGKKSKVSTGTYIFTLVGTVGVTLTMLVTVFFLAPKAIPTTGFFSMFYHSNFFFHLVSPVLSIIVFVFYEKSDRISFRHTFTGIVPMLCYAVYYIYEALTHIQDGAIAPGYDWYGFLFAGVKSAVIVIPLLILITYGISAALWRLNRKK